MIYCVKKSHLASEVLDLLKLITFSAPFVKLAPWHDCWSQVRQGSLNKTILHHCCRMYFFRDVSTLLSLKRKDISFGFFSHSDIHRVFPDHLTCIQEITRGLKKIKSDFMFRTLKAHWFINSPFECSNRKPTCLSHPPDYFKLVKRLMPTAWRLMWPRYLVPSWFGWDGIIYVCWSLQFFFLHLLKNHWHLSRVLAYLLDRNYNMLLKKKKHTLQS